MATGVARDRPGRTGPSGGGVQFEAVQSAGEDTVLLQEQPARVLQIDLATPALVGTLVPRRAGRASAPGGVAGDRSSRGESMVVTECGHLLVVKEKDPPAILEFGPPATLQSGGAAAADRPSGARRRRVHRACHVVAGETMHSGFPTSATPP